MENNNIFRRYLQSRLAIGVTITLFISLALTWLMVGKNFNLWQLQLADSLYQPQTPRQDIVLVTIDERTLQEFDAPARWDRSLYAEALKNLNQYNPKLVLFDIVFQNPRSPQGDKSFEEALTQAPPTILASWHTVPGLENGRAISAGEVRGPIASFSDLKNTVTAAVNVFPDQDEVVRNYIPGVYTSSTTEEKTFAFQVIQLLEEMGDAQGSVQAGPIPLENGQMLINYFSDPTIAAGVNTEQTFSKISFIDLYNDRITIDPALINDAIVLFGAYDPLLQDAAFTPVSDTHQMYGVEIHANAIQTILDQKFLRNLTPTEKILLILFITALTTAIFLTTKIRYSLLALIAIPLAYAALAQPLFARGIIPDMVHPYLAIIATFITSYIYRYLTEFKQKMQLKNAFSRYVHPTVVQQIMADPDQFKLGGEKREITVLFTDIVGFTSISEKLQPESLVALLNEYLEVMANIIMEEGGTVDKYEGDAIMAFFGAPISQEDHAARACRAALRMGEALQQLQQQWAKSGPLPGGEARPALNYRCGISTGEAIVGNIGSSNKLNYTAIGDTVNLGSRLEGANKQYGTTIMISENVYQKVKTAFEARELDIIRVVGKKQPIRVYELLNTKDQLVDGAIKLLELYGQGIGLYREHKFDEALTHFRQILTTYPQDGPSRLYEQRCAILKDFPPPPDWDGVFEMTKK